MFCCRSIERRLPGVSCRMKTGIAILIALAAASTPLVAQETVRFVSLNNKADRFTIRIREAH